MTLSAKRLADEVALGNKGDERGIAVVPSPDLVKLADDGEAAINLRLGRWFLTLRQASETFLSATYTETQHENRHARTSFVPFGKEYILHPSRFVLASTLEWIRLPHNYSAFVVGKSTLGRRGVVIETAAGVHPGFSGCLTLEIANVGEVPVKLMAGMLVCQLFVQTVEGAPAAAKTSLAGQRKPRLGILREDALLTKLKKTAR